MCTNKKLGNVKNMPSLDKKDLEQIKDTVKNTVIEAVDPYFTAIQENFNNIDENFKHLDERFDKIEKLILADHKRRIEKLETEVKELKELLFVK